MTRAGTLAPYCTPNGPARYSAIEVHNPADPNNEYVTVGWYEFYLVLGGTPVDFCCYTVDQAYINNVQVHYHSGDIIPGNQGMRWKVINVSGGNDWSFYYDPDDDGLNYVYLDTYGPMNYNIGLPMARTSRRGATTVAYDHPHNLKWADQPDDQGWHLWDTNILYSDTIPGWHWAWESNNAYQVVAD
jgi:hypothetical protein